MGDIRISNQRRVPITRNGMFYDKDQFEFDMEIGREYVEGDMGQRIILFSVDLSKTNQDQLYGETRPGSLSYFPPVEIPCVFEIKPSELRAYDKSKSLGTYQKMGQLVFGVYTYTLEEYEVDIKVGDMVGIQVDESHMIYWSVENDGKNNLDNQHMMFGTTPYYRSITCSWVNPEVFNG